MSNSPPVSLVVFQDSLDGVVIEARQVPPVNVGDEVLLNDSPHRVSQVCNKEGWQLALVLSLDPQREGAPGPFLGELERVIAERQSSSAEKSYTKSLLVGGADKIGRKLREEANELAVAIAEETDERVASEAGDVVFHLLVGLRLRSLRWRRVIEVLAQRFGTSGHTEKANRTSA